MRNRPAWTARCKSGYVFLGKQCRKPCRRGMLMCDDCLRAEPYIDTVYTAKSGTRGFISAADMVCLSLVLACLMAIAIIGHFDPAALR